MSGVDRRKQELERDKWKKHLLDLRTRREKQAQRRFAKFPCGNWPSKWQQESDILQKEKLFYELQDCLHHCCAKPC